MRLNYGKVKNKEEKKRLRRKMSIRKKINGTADKPRICVLKSNKNLQVLAFNDVLAVTICSNRTFGKHKLGEASNIVSAKVIGQEFAKNLIKNGINKAVFDRNGRQYTGVVKEVADAIRASGIIF